MTTQQAARLATYVVTVKADQDLTQNYSRFYRDYPSALGVWEFVQFDNDGNGNELHSVTVLDHDMAAFEQALNADSAVIEFEYSTFVYL